ncbi:hypothetical protein GCM10008961_39450 [Deinococcus knuensis]|uniref:Uncharacterized protein n=1 Tax=Deinococcus knuensis TaxID=1837380 RepID=A0ABQ2T166_9DEIO|nr:hypothetical protein GCM10008961_39450 [Deinococcus knuensis]
MPLAHMLNNEISFDSFGVDVDNLLEIIQQGTFQYNDLYINWQDEMILSYGFVSNESKYNFRRLVSMNEISKILEELRAILIMADDYIGSIENHEKLFSSCYKLEFRASTK